MFLYYCCVWSWLFIIDIACLCDLLQYYPGLLFCILLLNLLIDVLIVQRVMCSLMATACHPGASHVVNDLRLSLSCNLATAPSGLVEHYQRCGSQEVVYCVVSFCCVGYDTNLVGFLLVYIYTHIHNVCAISLFKLLSFSVLSWTLEKVQLFSSWSFLPFVCGYFDFSYTLVLWIVL